MIDAAVQRKNMVESQIRPSDVTDRRIIRAMLETPRERFVPSTLASLAYMDEVIALETGGRPPHRAMMAPRAFAKLAQAAEINQGDIVLDVGCATGYSSAILARLAETVVALESDSAMGEKAQSILSDLAIDNVVIVNGELEYGYPKEGPYDAIVVEGLVERMPDDLLDQLKDGGRLVAVFRDRGLSYAAVWRRIGQNFDRRDLFECSAPPLAGFAQPETFVF